MVSINHNDNYIVIIIIIYSTRAKLFQQSKFRWFVGPANNVNNVPAGGCFLNQGAEDVHFPSTFHPVAAHRLVSVYCHQGTNLSECD